MASSSSIPSAQRLHGKVAVITGGASGIGECTARLFCKHGAKVVIADVQDEKGQLVCDEIGKDSATFFHCDVTNESDVKSAVDTAVEKYGKLDIMFNNAGIVGPFVTEIVDTEQSDFERTMSVNLTGSFLGTKHAARVMIPAGKGSIVMTASIASVIGGGSTHGYTCSKHAIVGLVKSAAADLGKHGIRVNCVSPHLLATTMAVELLRMSEAEVENVAERAGNLKGVVLKTEDVANAVLFLASDESKYVSGHNLVVDGGLTTTFFELVRD